MDLQTDDLTKRRLTERFELIAAAEFLIGRGLAPDDVPVQLSRFYYVDIDMLNEVLAEITRASDEAEAWREVA